VRGHCPPDSQRALLFDHGISAAFGVRELNMSDQLKITKSERAHLRGLAEEAWNDELRDALTELYEEFGKWADDGLSAFELADKIHEFHDGISRELYKRYSLDPEVAVSRAVALGIVEEGALGQPLAGKLSRMIDSFRKMQNE
jgi:hypothetical protein